MRCINNSNFAYLIGNFAADGSFYNADRGYRFEFTDGSPYRSELEYSLEHLNIIKNILEVFLSKNLPDIRKRGNRFVLSFRNKELAELFMSIFKFKPGDKSKTINIPEAYKNSNFEKDFWVGYLDGDGSIARKSRKISVESMSKKIIDSFSEYLKKNNIFHSKYKSIRNEDYSYVIVIRSISFRDFCDKVGFRHPLKSKLIKEKLNEKDFFVNNNIIDLKKNEIIDYTQFFNGSIFIENGRNLVNDYVPRYPRMNIRFNEVYSILNNRLTKNEILIKIHKYRFKKSKGSINSVKLPLYQDSDILKLAKFVRIRSGGITFSKRYVESFNENFEEIVNLAERMFDIKPKLTCKKEPIFCSGVLADLFNNITKRESQNYKNT